MYRSISCFLILVLLITLCAVAQKPKILGETQYFQFHTNYWFNLHHFLQLEALLQETQDSTLISSEQLARLNETEREELDAAVAFYREQLLKEDLRMSPYQSSFKEWISQQEDGVLQSPPESMLTHVKVLESVSPLYKTYIWPKHKSTIHQHLESQLAGIQQMEHKVAKLLEELTLAYWQRERIRVDVCYYGKSTSWNLRNRPYTSTDPTHVVMNVDGEENEPYGNWLELLFHEASHHLIGANTGFVAGTIKDVCRVRGAKTPRGLWHAYLFYFSGKVVQNELPSLGINDYQLYMQRNGVFRRYFPLLELHLPLYMAGEKTLAEVTVAIVDGLE